MCHDRGMADKDPTSRYKVSIDDLERSAHVRPEDQVETQPDEVDSSVPQLPESVREALNIARLGGY
jgi:hypothetical protein